ncbi:MAG: hypothetical protein ACT4QE_15685 [Anaerolineales bacterium]
MKTQNLPSMAQNPLIAGAIGLVIGLIIGLPVLGWWLTPVEFKDADYTYLRADLKQQYLETVATALAADQDQQKAMQRVAQLGPDWQTHLQAAIATAPAGSVQALRLGTLQQVMSTVPGVPPGVTPPVAGGGLGGLILPLAGCLLVIALGVGGGLLYLRSRGGAGSVSVGRPSMVRPATPDFEEMAAPTTSAGAGAPAAAIARFMTTYTLGDDVYDDSFSIDGPDGNFLGECGMGISETIGVGDPKKVTAFEVWLFDKNDIRTVTKVIMSEHAFRDEALKSRLAAKGEPVQAFPGDTVTLETQTLIVTARIVDTAYGGGALPPNSFFERMTIELQAFRKPGAPAAQPTP